MAKYRWHEDQFITDVAARRGTRLEGNAGSGWRVHSSPDAADGVTWLLTLTPASGEVGPQIVWRTSDLRAGDDDRLQLVVGRSAEGGTSFGAIEGGALGLAITGASLAIGKLFGRRRTSGAADEKPTAAEPLSPEPAKPLGPGWSVFDPSHVLDESLSPAFNTWPDAWWGPDDERPARLDRLWLNQSGLEITASQWWCSAPALDQIIDLGVAVTNRLRQSGF